MMPVPERHPSAAPRPTRSSAQPVLRYLRRALWCATALTAVAGVAPAAGAQGLPSGGTVVNGSASISTGSNNVTIDQSSHRAVIDWANFDIAHGNRVDFRQPGADSWTLNRDLSGDISNIDGILSANGNVVLQNPHGVHIGGTAEIEVNSIIATTHGVDPNGFMAGDMTFDAPGVPDATVFNDGSITVNDGGLAALVAPAVSNNGTVVAREGTVVLAAGETSTYDFYGDGLINVAVTSPTTQVPVGPDGQPVAALVANPGAVFADGGTVVLSAAQLESVVVNAINLDGIVQANAIASEGGQVALVSDTGPTTVSGTVTADGAGADQSGGTVQIAAPAVEVAPTAMVSASGPAGGGAVLVGADETAAAADRALGVSSDPGDGLLISLERTLAELADAPATESVTVAAGAEIAADGGTGDGGLVDLWAGNALLVSGTVTADSVAAAGGHVTMTAATTSLTGAAVSASGADQGGEVLIGGGFRGEGTLAHAAATFVDAASTVSAVATDATGIGGTVVLWSTNATGSAGTLSAGPENGLIEVSSLGSVGLTGTVDAGLGGMVLLDPTFIEITAAGFGDIADAVFGTTGLLSIDPGTIAAALNLDNDVLLQANTDITVTDAITSTGTGSLALQAGRDIVINAGITLAGGDFIATANDSRATRADRQDGAGDIVMAADTVVTTSDDGAVLLSVDRTDDSDFTPGNITIAGITTGTAGRVVLESFAGNILQTTGLGITTGTLGTTAVDAGTADARIIYNATASDLDLALGGGGFFDLSGSAAPSVTVFGSTKGELDLLGDDQVAIVVGDASGNGLTVGTTFTVTEIAGMTQNAVLSAGTLTGSSYGDINLFTQDNQIVSLDVIEGLASSGTEPALFELRNRRDLAFLVESSGLSGFTTVNLDLEGSNFIGVQNFIPRIAAANLSIVAESIVDLLEFAATVDGATLELDLAAPPINGRVSEINIAVADGTATTPHTVNVYGQVTSDSADPSLVLRSDSLVVINIGDGGGGTVGLTVDGTLTISGDAGITQDDPITATALSLASLADIDLSHGLNDVDRLLEAVSSLGSITLTDVDDLELDGRVIAPGTLTLTLGSALTDADGTVVIDGLTVPNPNGGGYLLAPFVNVNAASAGAPGAPIRIHALPDSQYAVADLETRTLDLSQLFDPLVTLGLSGDGFFEFLVTNDAGLPTSLDDLLNNAFPNDPDGLAAFKRNNPDLIAFLERIDFDIGVRNFNVAGTVASNTGTPNLTLTGGELPIIVNNAILEPGNGSVGLVFDDGDDSNVDAALTVDGTLTVNDFTSVGQAAGERVKLGELEGFVLGDITLPELANDIDALGTLVSVDGAIDIDTQGDVELTGVVYSSILVDLFLLGGVLTNEREDGPLSPFLPDGVLAPRFNLRASGAGSADAGVNVLALPNVTDGPIRDRLPAGTFDDPIVELVRLSQDSYLNLLVVNTNPVTVNGVPYLQTGPGFDPGAVTPTTFGDRTFNVFGTVDIGEGLGPSLTLTGGETSTVHFLDDLPVFFDDVPTVRDLLEVVLGGAIANAPYAFTDPLPAFEEIAGDGSVAVNIGDGGAGTDGLLVQNVLTIDNVLRVTQDDALTTRMLAGSTINDGTVVLTTLANTVRSLGDFDTGNGNFSLTTLGSLELAGLVDNGLGTTTLTVDEDLTDETDSGVPEAVRSAALVVTADNAGAAAAPIAYQATAPGSDLDLALNTDGFFDLTTLPGVPAVDVLGAVTGSLALAGGNAATVNIGSNGNGLTVGDTLRFVNVAAVTQSASLIADILAGDTGGGSIDLSLDGATDIDFLGDLSTGNGDLTLSDIDGLELIGLVDAGNGQVVLVLAGDLTTGVDGSVRSAALILTAANAGSDLAPIVYTATGSQLALDLSGDGTFRLDGETTNVYGFVDGVLAVLSDDTTMNIGDGDGTLLEGPGAGALVIGERFDTAVSQRTDEDCLFVAGDGPCGRIEDFLPTTPTTSTTAFEDPSILLITFGDEEFDPTLGIDSLTPGDAAFRVSEFNTPTVADLFDRPFPLGPASPPAGPPEDVTDLGALEPGAGGPETTDTPADPSEDTCVSTFFGDFWNAAEACQ